MKAIIVDDEAHMRDAVELMLDWKSYDIREVFYAQNGLEALKIIEEQKPELMFLDMEMPVMGGKALLNEIVKNQIKIHVIAISGYSDFEYVHATLMAKGVDYILKPFARETLVRAVEKAVARIRGEKEEAAKSRQYEQMGIAMANQVLQRFCRGEVLEQEQVKEAFIKLGAREGKFLLVSILNRNAAEIIEDRYGGDRDLCFFTVGNILRDIFKTYLFRQDIFADEFNWQLFLQEYDLNPFKVTDKMKIFEKKIEDTIGLKITWVVSLEPVEIENLKKTVYEQNGLLQQRNVWGCGMMASGQRNMQMNRNTVLSMELRLLSVMEDKDREKLYEIIGDYCRQLRSAEAMKLKELQDCTADMNLLLRRIASGQNMETQMEPLSLWINDIDVWEREVLNRLLMLMEHFKTKEEPAEKIYSYIKEHYAENITLSTIAADFYQTPQYMARIFKSRYDMTIVTAIIKVRMEKACELLRTGKKSVAQVAEMVGYEDENYFGRVFKKYTGMTPAQYRRGQSE